MSNIITFLFFVIFKCEDLYIFVVENNNNNNFNFK